MSPTVTSAVDLESLLDSLPNLNPNDQALIERAYLKAEYAHQDQTRKSGEPYITHCLAVASILADLKLDPEAIAAALMHDVVEDHEDIEIEEIQDEFGPTIALLVDGVTKMTKITNDENKSKLMNGNGKRPRDTNRELEYIRKMLLAMNNDVRVVLIKLADRLHNMRTLGFMSPHKQIEIARETLEIFAPLANRLGIWQIKWELEDLSFRYLDPEGYKAIARSIDERRTDRESYIEDTVQHLRDELNRYDELQNAYISGRPKHIYSIHLKMSRKQVPYEKVFDARAIRIIVDTIPQCYLALGVVHSIWRPLKEEFDDYIALPKDNFYRSLHTAVRDGNGKTIEVQIRTWEMHENAEYGVAAHWRYKEGSRDHDKNYEDRLSYVRKLMEDMEGKEDPESFINMMKTEVFQDRVYAYTPKGDIVDLPAGATPIDFAYHIHTEIGNRCRGARVNGKLVGLDYALKTGDQVEISTTKRGGPSLDWLNPDLGYVKTSRAKSKIRYWFRKQNRDKHISLGREIVEREIKRLNMGDSMSFERLAGIFNYDSVEDFMAAVGAGDINNSQIAHRMLDEEHEKQKLRDVTSLVRKSRAISNTANDKSGIKIMGTGGLLVNFARCCNPTPGDEITGYVTRGRGVTIHRVDCPNIVANPDTERIIDVEWGEIDEEQRYAVPVRIVAYDREGLLRDISTIIADEKVNLSDVKVSTQGEIANFYVTMEICSNQQLTRVLTKIEQIQSVVESYRCNPA